MLAVRSRHHLSPPCHHFEMKVVTTKTQTGSGFQPFRHLCHYFITRFDGKTKSPPIPAVRPGQRIHGGKVVEVVTDWRNRPSDAGFGRHYFDFKVVTRHHIVVTDCAENFTPTKLLNR